MISAVNNNVSFTSVVPVRVFVDGLETFNPKLISTSCHQLNNILKGPSSNGRRLSIIQKFAKHDPDYSYINGFCGYGSIASDFFRCASKDNKSYIFTGVHADTLKKLGKSIGIEKRNCKDRGDKNSFDLMYSKKSYEQKLKNFLNNKRIRITEAFNSINHERTGRPVQLDIFMSSNKKYGLSTFKMNLEDIGFSL